MASISSHGQTKRKCEYTDEVSKRQNSGFDDDVVDDNDGDELLEDCPLEDPELTEEEERSLDYIPEYNPDIRTSGGIHISSDSSDSSGMDDLMSTVANLSGFPASFWNKHPKIVYSVLKVKRFIVHPNYILCMTTNPYEAKKQTYDPTVNTILKRNYYGNPSYVKWNDVKDELLKVQSVFHGCDHIPNILRDAKAAAADIRGNFRQRISRCLRRKDITSRAYKDLLCFLQDFSGEFVNNLKLHKLNEKEMFTEYLNRLVSFFTTTLMIPGAQPISSLSLDLVPGGKSECRTVTVKPDFQLSSYNNIVLVGKATKFGVVPKAYEDYKGHQVEDPVENKLLPGPTGDEPKTPQNSAAPKYYRCLNRKECFKIDSYLPQLIAQMLAAMDTNKKRGRYVKLCQDNERVQLGLTLEGFKLRFVRLVLRHADPDTEPDLSTLSSSLVRCDVFLTQELNLFKGHHLKMFFQILYAILKAHD